jgi:hypothetical protein
MSIANRSEEKNQIGNLILRRAAQLCAKCSSTVLMVQPNGEAVEVCLIGKEGFVGLPVRNKRPGTNPLAGGGTRGGDVEQNSSFSAFRR